MLPKFNKYDSIPTKNSLGRFAMFEKIHGANCSISLNSFEFNVYNRTGILNPGDSFFNWEDAVVDKLSEFRKLFQVIDSYYTTITESQPKNMPVTSIQVYGELFGGSYPGVKSPKSQRVNKGVFYCSTNEFLPFDVRVFVNGGNFILDQILLQGFAESINLMISKPLFVGNMKDCLDQDVMINSTIPALYGMPKLESNLSKGVVIKPWSSSDYNKGLMIKIINPIFKEKKRNRLQCPKCKSFEISREIIGTEYETVCGECKYYDNSDKFKQVKKSSADVPEHLQRLINVFDEYITDIRLDKVLTKHLIDRTAKNIPKIASLYISDLYEDVKAEEHTQIPHDDLLLIKKRVSNLVFDFVRKAIV